MGVISRGFKNAFRNTIRTVSITFILALSIAMSLVMLLALKTVQGKISEVKGSIGNSITVSPAGVRGFEGGGTLLISQNASDIKSLAHVTGVIETFNGRLTTIGATNNLPFGKNEESNSNAKTSLTAPPVKAPAGDSAAGGSSSGRQRRMFINGQSVDGGNFSMPITVIGINDLSNTSLLNASSFTMTAGDKIDPAGSSNEALLSSALASQNNLTAGGTFTAYGQTITVKGVFDGGNTFANSIVIMPIATVQNLSGNTDQVNSMLVTTDSVDSLTSVQTAIKDKLGDSVDVTSSEETAKNAVAPLENIKTISLYSLIGAVAAGAIIIFLTMMMIVRERRREIGVLKAIGSSNISIVSQFTVESLALTLMSSVIGIALGMIFSNPVLKVLINNSESASLSASGPGQYVSRGGQMMARMGEGFATARNTIQNLHAVVGFEVIVYGFLAAIAIAIIGSAIPAFFIAKVRPAEVMRAE